MATPTKVHLLTEFFIGWSTRGNGYRELMNLDNLIQFARALVQRPSLSGEEEAVAKRVKEEMLSLGYDRVYVDENGSVVGIVNGAMPGRTLLFDAHTDTVDVKSEEEMEEEEFRDMFPALSRELREGEVGIMEEEARTSAGSKKVRKFRGYTPGVIDFICRCKSDEEDEEIIHYLFEKGDITEETADNLRRQLKEKGLEFFGEHRTPGYYERA